MKYNNIHDQQEAFLIVESGGKQAAIEHCQTKILECLTEFTLCSDMVSKDKNDLPFILKVLSTHCILFQNH